MSGLHSALQLMSRTDERSAKRKNRDQRQPQGWRSPNAWEKLAFLLPFFTKSKTFHKRNHVQPKVKLYKGALHGCRWKMKK